MSALSASKILLKGSAVSSKVPDLTSVDLRELAVNTADGKLFTKTTQDEIVSFLNSSQLPYVFNQTLNSVTIQYGSSLVTGLFGSVLNGNNNNVSGSGSTIVNGENNIINGDFSFIGNGLNNTIASNGEYGAIVGGKNNTLNHFESFIIGSNITSHLSGFTYVNNLSVLGKIYGDGSNLLGVTGDGGGGDESVNTLVRSGSATWNETSTVVAANSGNWAPVKKFDMIYSPSTVSYSGTAPSGSLTSHSTWTITKLSFASDGSVSNTKVASNVSWNDRLTTTYF